MIHYIVPPIVRNDDQGLGHYGAPRGSRTHRGIDYVVEPGAEVLSPCDGKVIKHGFCYPAPWDKYRYIEIEGVHGHRYRLFYVEPISHPHEMVKKGQRVARAMDISEKYPGMTPNVHFEIKTPEGDYIDPDTL